MSEHYGATVEKVVRREGHSLTDLAKIVGVNRRSLYNWFLQQRLSTEVILKIGRAIKHDFSAEFPGEFVPADFEIIAKTNLSSGPTSTETINVWQEKYIDLLERYNLLLTANQEVATTPSESSFNVSFVNAKSDEYKIKLNNPPSDLFLEKCKKAGYKIKCVNRGEIANGQNHTSKSLSGIQSLYEPI